VGPKAGVILPKGEGATCWGWLYPDKILAMTKGKLAYEFRRSLPLNDKGKKRDYWTRPRC
jgi:hypothetical protein